MWKLPDLEKEIEELKELYKTADEKKRKEIEERLEELRTSKNTERRKFDGRKTGEKSWPGAFPDRPGNEGDRYESGG